MSNEPRTEVTALARVLTTYFDRNNHVARELLAIFTQDDRRAIAEREIAEAIARVKELEEVLSATLAALGAYGHHHEWCGDPAGYPSVRCECGYLVALAAARARLTLPGGQS